MGEMPVSMRPPVTRPPHFDVLMNSIRGLTRKVDHIKVIFIIKGFKFELGGSISNNMHLTGTWSLPNPSLPKKNPFGMPKPPNTGEF